MCLPCLCLSSIRKEAKFFFRTEAQRQSSGKRRKVQYSADSTDLSMAITDYFQGLFAKLILLTN